MIVLKRLPHLLLIALTMCSYAVAEAPDELKQLVFSGDMYGRSSVNFTKNADNIESVIPKDTKADVLETKVLRSGAYAVRIRVTDVGPTADSKMVPKVGDENWVYYSKKDPWLNFTSPEGEAVTNPEEALAARANKTGAGIPVANDPLVNGFAETPPPAETSAAFSALLGNRDPNLVRATADKSQTEAAAMTTPCSGPDCPQNKTIKENHRAIRDVKNKIEDDNKPVGDMDEAIRRYSNSAGVRKMINSAMSHRLSKSEGHCYRAVKSALMAGGLVRTRPEGRKAKDGIADLKAQGFVNLLDDPTYRKKIKSPGDAPKGALIVYRYPHDSAAGDISIKIDEGKDSHYVAEIYSRDYRLSPSASRNCRFGSCPYFAGVMIKP